MRSSQLLALSKPDTGSQTGPGIWVGQICSASFVPVFGDTDAAGSIKIQCSNEIPPPGTVCVGYQPSAASFKDIPNATSTIVAGVGPAIVIGSMCFAYVRAVFTSSNAGSTTVQVQMNQIGV